MKTLESGLWKDDIFIPCFYFEIEDKCKEIVSNYCAFSEKNNQEFVEFSKNYCHFKPYFDFVVTRLGYTILNPEMESDMLLWGSENHMYKSKDKNDKKSFCYDLSDDKTLQIYPMKMDSSIFHDCLIDGEGNHLLPNDMFGHLHIFQQILNMILIANENICKDYLEYSGDIGVFVQRYLPLIRFQVDILEKNVITRCVYRNDNTTQIQKDFMEDLLANRYSYPSCLFDLSKNDIMKTPCDISEKLEFRSVNNEYRRF